MTRGSFGALESNQINSMKSEISDKFIPKRESLISAKKNTLNMYLTKVQKIPLHKQHTRQDS